jgi:hypothetical protein
MTDALIDAKFHPRREIRKRFVSQNWAQMQTLQFGRKLQLHIQPKDEINGASGAIPIKKWLEPLKGPQSWVVDQPLRWARG